MTNALPGQDLIETGIADLARGTQSIEAFLVSIGAPRLRRVGVDVSYPIPSPERKLYELLASSDSDSAHSRYNALIRRLVSYERAAECVAPEDEARLRSFLRALGAQTDEETRVYLTGGSTAVLQGWRRTTIDVDLKMVPESDSMLRAIPRLKEELEINVELAAPDQFIPEVPGWAQRSLFISREGRASFYQYDFYAQALAKIERGHDKDLADVEEMCKRRLIEPLELQRHFEEIEPMLYRFPAIEPKSFRKAVERVVEKPIAEMNEERRQ